MGNVMKANLQRLAIKALIITILYLLLNPSPGETGNNPKKPYYNDSRYINAYKKVVQLYNPSLDSDTTDKIVKAMLFYSHKYSLDPRFVVAVIAVESSFRTKAVSKAGAQGLGQLMPEVAKELGIKNVYKPEENIHGTVYLLHLNLKRFAHLNPQKQVEYALASYNAGYGAVKKYGGIPPYNETKWYIYNVIDVWRKLCGLD